MLCLDRNCASYAVSPLSVMRSLAKERLCSLYSEQIVSVNNSQLVSCLYLWVAPLQADLETFDHILCAEIRHLRQQRKWPSCVYLGTDHVHFPATLESKAALSFVLLPSSGMPPLCYKMTCTATNKVYAGQAKTLKNNSSNIRSAHHYQRERTPSFTHLLKDFLDSPYHKIV